MGGPGSGRGKRSFGRISRGGGSRAIRGGRTVPTLIICSPPVFNMGVKANMPFAP
jgi:hypothetical protein